ncbi:MAG: hypothetical protein WKG07_28580 [Hymenobacter sp.]
MKATPRRCQHFPSSANELKTRPAARRRTAENTHSDPALRERLKTKIRGRSQGRRARHLERPQVAAAHAGLPEGRRRLPPAPPQLQASQPAPLDRARLANRRWPARPPPRRHHRCLPADAWDKLTPAQKKATNAKKKAGSEAGEHTVPNTAAAKRAPQSGRVGRPGLALLTARLS